MKKHLLTALSACLFAAPAQNVMAEDWYLNFNTPSYMEQADASSDNTTEGFISKSTAENSLSFSASLGYRLNGNDTTTENKRIEAEFLNRSSESGVAASGVMANAFYDFRSGSPIVPYIGGGAGIANVRLAGSEKFSSTNEIHGTSPAYQTMAGVAYTTESYPYTSMRLGYRFFKTAAPAAVEYSSHNLDASVKVDF